jgi:hypothetical protein
MSRGPGRIERVVKATLHDADRSFSVEELACIAYPDINTVEKKHRVAVFRAISKMAKRGDVLVWQWRTNNEGRHFVCNGANVRSYAHGWVRQSRPEWPLEQVDDILSDWEIQSAMDLGGLIWIDVEIAKAEHEQWKLLDAAGLCEQMRKGGVERDRLPPGYLELSEHRAALHAYRCSVFGPHYNTASGYSESRVLLLGKFEPPGSPIHEYAMKLRRAEAQCRGGEK